MKNKRYDQWLIENPAVRRVKLRFNKITTPYKGELASSTTSFYLMDLYVLFINISYYLIRDCCDEFTEKIEFQTPSNQPLVEESLGESQHLIQLFSRHPQSNLYDQRHQNL